MPGANENLSGSAVAIEVMRSIKESETPLEHTEVGVILTGSGAVGSRGAHAWCEKYVKDDVKTSFVGPFISFFDTHFSKKWIRSA